MNIKSIQILGIFVFVFLMDTNESQKEERECKALFVCAHIRLSVCQFLVLCRSVRKYLETCFYKKKRERREKRERSDQYFVCISNSS